MTTYVEVDFDEDVPEDEKDGIVLRVADTVLCETGSRKRIALLEPGRPVGAFLDMLRQSARIAHVRRLLPRGNTVTV
jgi:hypothetical protein